MSKKLLFAALLLIITAGAGAAVYVTIAGANDQMQNNRSAPATDAQPTADQPASSIEDDASTITITATGDMLAHDSVLVNAQINDGYDFTPYFSSVSDLLQSDITFCNQEGASAGADFGIAGYPSFNAPEKFATDLESVGCNVINLANNHVLDRGQASVDATRAVWDGLNPLAVAGANRSQVEQDGISYFEVKGVRFAFIAFTDLSNAAPAAPYSINFFSDSLVKSLATEAVANADVVIASAHWGVEYSSEISQSQEQWAQLLAGYGVDVIFGTGPHVLQPVDIISNDEHQTVVFYSLGNFLSTQLEIDQLIGGAARLTLDVDDLNISDISFTPTYMHYEWTADEATAEDLLARHSLKLYKLSEAADPLSRSLFATTVEEQRSRVEALLNQRTNVLITD